jgi:OOP family OmpA-OmpF porin
MHQPRARALLTPALASLLIAIAAVPGAHAVEERGWVSVEVGSDLYDAEQAFRDGPGFGLRAAGFLNRWIGLEALFHTASPSLEQPATGDATFAHYGVGLILTPDRYRWALPYMYGGIGSATVERDGGGSKSYSAFHGGGGVVFRAGERLGFRLDARNISYLQDPGPGRNARVNSFFISGAVTALWFGRPRDSDEDGVPNKIDRCPATPTGAVVDASGCPLDTDADKVWDGLDKCTGTPAGAVVDATGCPIDSDKDGVFDGLDQCDSTATGVVVDEKGCGIDSDGDAVLDGLDQCAETPKGSVVDPQGCPIDGDGDGVPDGVDICPETPAGIAVNAGGCPVSLLPREQELLDTWMIRLTDLEFVPDSARILDPGLARIDSVAAVLKQWPALKFEIGVHVDDTAEPGYRIPLSATRARAVLQYLFRQNPTLNQKNFWITGYGDSDPVVPNTSTENRARNRRVDFRLMNMHVLTQERDRRASFGSAPVPPAPGLEPKMPPAPQEEPPAPPAPQDEQPAPPAPQDEQPPDQPKQ